MIRHGGIFLCILIEIVINNIAFKWKHFILIAISSLAYFIINITVTLADKPVYPMMDWKSIKSYGFIAVGLITVVLTFMSGVFFYELIKMKRINQEILGE